MKSNTSIVRTSYRKFHRRTMFKKVILYGLCMLTNTASYASQQTTITPQAVTEQSEHAKAQEHQKDIDTQLYDLFKKFFNDHDDMPFVQFVTKLIHILKIQKNVLIGHHKVMCEDIIKKFEQNKSRTEFYIWAPILSDPNLRAIMSEQTRNYINNVSTQTKITALINKLKK